MKETLRDFYHRPSPPETKHNDMDKIIDDLAKIHGLGLVKAKALYNAGVRSVDDLKNGKMGILPTLPIETQAYLKYDVISRIPRRVIETLHKKLKANPIFNASTFEIAGSYRRGAAYSSDIDIVSTGKLDSLLGALSDDTVFVYSKGSDKASLLYRVKSGSILGKPMIVKLDVMICKPISYPYFLLYLTGSKEHNVKMRAIAKGMGMLLNQNGLYKNGMLVKAVDERSIFEALNLPYVEPKNR